MNGGWRFIAFRPQRVPLLSSNSLLGLPPVVVGLVVYVTLSRSGPLGPFGILFTPTAMIIAQGTLAVPIVMALAQLHYGGALG